MSKIKSHFWNAIEWLGDPMNTPIDEKVVDKLRKKPYTSFVESYKRRKSYEQKEIQHKVNYTR